MARRWAARSWPTCTTMPWAIRRDQLRRGHPLGHHAARPGVELMRGLIGRPPAEAGRERSLPLHSWCPRRSSGQRSAADEAVRAPIPAIACGESRPGTGSASRSRRGPGDPDRALVAVVGPTRRQVHTSQAHRRVLKPWTGTVEVLGARAGREAHRVHTCRRRSSSTGRSPSVSGTWR